MPQRGRCELTACDKGHVDCVKYLVESFDVDIDMRYPFGDTLLHVASPRVHLDCVKYLAGALNAGTDARETLGWTLSLDQTDMRRWSSGVHRHSRS
mmetsp:Transcript_15312/g.42354  ORF Transcript_15312/g.42354 Transcript_15312/m.42354 type:complete len:96 (-) Transcript_15312:341-628(-)